MSMLKPDYLDLDKDGNKTEPMKKAVKDRKPMYSGGAGASKKRMSYQEGGLLKDDREQYGLGGIASKILSKYNITPSKGKKITVKDAKQELKKLKEDLKDIKQTTPDDSRVDEIKLLEEEIEDLQADIIKITEGVSDDYSARGMVAEGGLLMDDQMLMVMTPPMESEMESDDDMENNYLDFIIGEALSSEEEAMLMSKMEQDEELSMLFDKVIDVAQEFAGSGPVEGPGSGVSDSIPARLSDGEFVFTAKAVEEIGEDTLMSMMKEAEAKVDERQPLNLGGMPMMEEEMKVDQYGKPVDPAVVDDEIRKGMLSANPRLRQR